MNELVGTAAMSNEEVRRALIDSGVDVLTADRMVKWRHRRLTAQSIENRLNGDHHDDPRP